MTNKDSGSKWGQGMIFIAWLLFLAMLTYAFNHYLEQQNNPNQQVSSTINRNIVEVKLKQNRYGHYVTSGQINQSKVTFLLDTGATLISIPASIAEELQLQKGYPFQSETANGTITVYSTLLDSVSIGDIKLDKIRASINPHMAGDEILLGMSFMKHLELIQKNKQLILRY